MEELRSDRGFLIYITRTYRTLNTFLKGIHLTLDGWRDNRGDDGWKLAKNHMRQKNHSNKEVNQSPHDYPDLVKSVPCLLGNLQTLAELTGMESAPVILVQTQ